MLIVYKSSLIFSVCIAVSRNMATTLWSIWASFQVTYLVPLIKILQTAIIIVTSLFFTQYHYPNANVYDGDIFDFIIVGGGSAGCVVANRLTEVANSTVLLVEAGDDPPFASEIPGISVIVDPKLPEWGYYTVSNKSASQALQNQRIHLFRGKMLGGSGNDNFMYWVRGNKRDYNQWNASGNAGWDWATVLEYFKKSEDLNDPEVLNSNSGSLHSTGGYLGVTRPKWKEQTEKLFNVLKENGRDIILDINGFQQLGYSVPSYNVNNKRRQSGSYAFLKPVVNRENLFIIKNTMATKIILNNGEALGVTIKDSSNILKNIYARKEIIISAGAINSPQVLMLSGIGPKEQLEKHGIETKLDIPNVGSNYQDHMIIPIIISGINSTVITDHLLALGNLDKFPVPTIMGHTALDKNQTYPDYQVTSFPLPVGSVFPTLMCSEVFGWDDNICVALANSTRRDVFFALITFLHPESRGTIELKSIDINDTPLIIPRYFSNNNDVKKYAKCVKDFTSIMNTTAFMRSSAEIVNCNVKQCRDIEFASQEYWECFVKNLASSQYHSSGTCSMGLQGEGVVDERLRVRGVKKLRVVDASIMPTIVSGNINAAVTMIAEKASDMIKIDNGYI